MKDEEAREKEFIAKWRDLFEQDCKPGQGQQGKFSRTITDTEVGTIGKHLYEWFNEVQLVLNVEELARVMMQTKTQSFQEWAKKIVKKLQK
ncbi:MAG: hypothetical protein AAB604_02045 [Patescibacteria group bacterium]